MSGQSGRVGYCENYSCLRCAIRLRGMAEKVDRFLHLRPCGTHRWCQSSPRLPRRSFERVPLQWASDPWLHGGGRAGMRGEGGVEWVERTVGNGWVHSRHEKPILSQRQDKKVRSEVKVMHARVCKTILRLRCKTIAAKGAVGATHLLAPVAAQRRRSSPSCSCQTTKMHPCTYQSPAG